MERRDADLMRDVQLGRVEPFEELVRRYRIPLLRLASSKLSDPVAAEDVVQEAFLAVYAARHSYRPEASFRTWLWTIALNLCKKYAQRAARPASSRRAVDPSHIDWSHSQPAKTNSLQQLMRTEQNEQLRFALEQLPEPQADALRLRFFGGLKFEEIAAAMECSLNGAKLRVKHGLIKLARLLPPPEEREP